MGKTAQRPRRRDEWSADKTVQRPGVEDKPQAWSMGKTAQRPRRRDEWSADKAVQRPGVEEKPQAWSMGKAAQRPRQRDEWSADKAVQRPGVGDKPQASGGIGARHWRRLQPGLDNPQGVAAARLKLAEEIMGED